ncbi:MAG: nitroreductase, partial [Ideonella sp.]
AAHALGFGAKMLSGLKVRAPNVVAAFCEPGETLVGWLVMGTPLVQARPKFNKPAAQALLLTWPAR